MVSMFDTDKGLIWMVLFSAMDWVNTFPFDQRETTGLVIFRLSLVGLFTAISVLKDFHPDSHHESLDWLV